MYQKMKVVIEIVKELQDLLTLREISSTNEKIEFLRKLAGNNLIESMLKLALDNSLVTNLASKKLSKKLKNKFEGTSLIPYSDPRNSIFSLIDYVVSEECSGTDVDIYRVQQFLNNYSEEESNLLIDFLIKKPRIGVSSANANKAIPGVVVDFVPMAAYNISKVKIDEAEDLYYATMKLDGHRCLIKVENGIKTAYSRNGKVIKNINEFLSRFNLPDGYIFDGELLATGTFEHSKDRFTATSVLLNSDAEINPLDIQYNIFDVLPIEEFYSSKSKLKYKDRRAFLNTLRDSDYYIVIPVLGKFKLADIELNLLFEKVIAEGNEGLMLNNENGLYQCKRTKDILKLKSDYDVDLRCVDVLEGQGKFANTTGSLAVEYKGNIVKVPSMSDDLREYFWNNKNEIIGKIITVKYCEETKNKEGQFSLRFPRFIAIRDDKNEPSVN